MQDNWPLFQTQEVDFQSTSRMRALFDYSPHPDKPVRLGNWAEEVGVAVTLPLLSAVPELAMVEALSVPELVSDNEMGGGVNDAACVAAAA